MSMTLSEKLNCLVHELAKVIAAMLDNEETDEVWETSYKLYKVIYEAKKTSINREDLDYRQRDLDYYLDKDANVLRAKLRQIQEILETEYPSEVMAPYKRQVDELLHNHDEKRFAEKRFADRDPGLQLIPPTTIFTADPSSPNELLSSMEKHLAILDEIENICAMTNLTEQAEAFADYSASKLVAEIITPYTLLTDLADPLETGEILLILTAAYLNFAHFWESEIIRLTFYLTELAVPLETEDLQRIIKETYLNFAYSWELEELARVFGHQDIVRKCETVIDKWHRHSTERELLRVLKNIIAQKNRGSLNLKAPKCG